MKFFVDADGNYLGGWVALSDEDGIVIDGQDLPEMFIGGIEVPTSPEHANQKWDGEEWLKLEVI